MKRSTKIKLYILIACVAFAIIGSSAVLFHYSSTPINPNGSKDSVVLVDIPAGSSFANTTEILNNAGLIKSRFLFYGLAFTKRALNPIKAGEYEFRGSMTPGAVIDKLLRGEVKHQTQQSSEPLKKTFNSPAFDYRVHDISLKTRYGKLKTAPSDDGDVLELNGKIIRGIGGDVIEFDKYFKLKNKDVILISENSMGNSGEGPHYAFITIFSDGTYTVELEKILNRDYYNGYMDSATQQEEIITVTFKRKIDKSIESIITYNEGKLYIERFDSRPTKGPAAKKNCKGLYEIYERCGGSSACNLREMAQVDIRNFDYYSQDKRLKTVIFDELCGAVCETKKRIGYQKFKKEICGY